MILIFFFTFIFLHFSTLFYFWGFSISSFSNSITSRMPQFKDSQIRTSVSMLIFFPFSHISNHICGKTGGNPQVLFSHIALNQRMPEGFIAYVHLSSCLSPGSGVPAPIISKFLLFHKHFLIQPPVPSGLCFSFLLLITST